MRKIGEAFSATTASLTNSLWIVRYGNRIDGARLFASHARHWFTQPTRSGASARATATCSSCEASAPKLIALSSPHEEQQRDQRHEAVAEIDADATLLQQAHHASEHLDDAGDGQVEPRP